MILAMLSQQWMFKNGSEERKRYSVDFTSQ